MLLRFSATIMAAQLTVFLANTPQAYAAEPPAAGEKVDKNNAARLKAVREVMGQITMRLKNEGAPPLEIKPDPVLRYNDVTRGILDSVVFSVGKQGRPVALISAELYGRKGDILLLNHEFVALANPNFEMKRDAFKWEPPQGNVVFTELKDVEPPSSNAKLRLVQMRKLSDDFTASQMFGAQRIQLRKLATPIDRYEPANSPNSDGAIFAFTWGVNPEAVLLLESDGQKWQFGWAPLSSAPLEARHNDEIVWKCPPGPHETKTAPYTSIYRELTVPAYFDDEIPEPKTP